MSAVDAAATLDYLVKTKICRIAVITALPLTLHRTYYEYKMTPVSFLPNKNGLKAPGDKTAIKNTFENHHIAADSVIATQP